MLAAAAALGLLTLVGACSAGSDDGTSTSDSSAGSVEAPAEASAADGALDSLTGQAEADLDATASRSVARDDAAAGASDTAQDVVPGDSRALIKTGNVALRSDDVETARFDVGKVLDAHGGEVAEESTQADDEGAMERVRLVLRVPVAEFDTTMTDLKAVADLIDVTTASQDVSTEVIDNEVRVELQRRSIDRISVLLDNAADLRDIVAIERELSRREADLGSLEKRQTFLADQTALATITLSIEPPRDEQEPRDDPEDEEETGFLAGLGDGWNALTDVTTGLLTVGGAVLPFAVVLLLLGIPARLVVRRLAQRPTAPAPTTTPPAATA